LELIRGHGIEPHIVEYLRHPPSAETTLLLAERLQSKVAALLRDGEDEFKAERATLDLADDAALADWLEAHPRALQRPIVVDEDSGRAVIGRPPENVHELLKT
jgi:arsenate reductase